MTRGTQSAFGKGRLFDLYSLRCSIHGRVDRSVGVGGDQTSRRRAVAPLTMLVVAGLMSAEFLGMASGFLPAIRVWAVLALQMVLLVGLALAFRAANER